jgi:hypothetical protein
MPGRTILALCHVAFLLLGSCTYWEPYPTPAPAQQRLPSSLRATDPTGSRILLVEPYIRSDTLFGLAGRDTVGISLRRFPRLERQRVHAVRTIALVLAIVAASIPLSLTTMQ